MRHLSIFGAAALGLAAASAMAQSETAFKFSGFGSLAATKSSEKNADFVTRQAEPNGSGVTRSLDFGADSRIGVQFDAKFSDMFSVVVQAISDHRYDDTYTPDLSMAHLKVQATPNLSLRVGRMPFSAYLISDYQKVGYSTPWVRPPLEVYEFNPISHFDGADIGLRQALGNASLFWQLSAGSSKVNLPPGKEGASEFRLENMVSLSVTATYGSGTYRAYHMRSKATVNDAYLDGPAGPFAGLRAPQILHPIYGVVPNPYFSPALAAQYQVKDKVVTYTSLGFNYDPGDWFVTGEVARNAGDEAMVTHATALYVTGGARFGAWTPYLTVAQRKDDTPVTHSNYIVDQVLSGNDKAQSSTAFGLRWDFRAGMDLKLQYDLIKNAANSRGVLVGLQPAFKAGESYNVATLSFEFVF